MVGNIKILVELFAYLYCFAELFGKKFKVNIYVVALIVMGMFLATGIDNYDFPKQLSSLVYIGVFLYGVVCYKESIKLTLVNCVLTPLVIAVLQIFIFLPLYYLFFKKSGQNQINEVLINTGCFVILILGSKKIKLKRLSDFVMKRDILIMATSVLILCGFGIEFFQMKKEGTILVEAYYQMIYFIVIFLFVIYEWQKSRMDAEKRKTQLEMNRLYYDAYDQLILLVRQRQHDMKSHISTIKSMIFTIDNYEELVEKQKEYCDYVIEQNDTTRLVLAVENPLLAGFLYSKIQETAARDIKIDYHIAIPKESSAVPEYELIEMLGILIDNAIDAMDNPWTDTEKQRTREIRVTLRENEEGTELIVSNTSDYFDEDITELFFESGYSSKGKGRGIGLPKLKRLVQNRKGDIVVSNDLHDERNYLTFTINLPREKNKNLAKINKTGVAG